MARILAVCRSDKKGTKKDDVAEGYFRLDYGMENDAHADSESHRQVSLMAIESIDKMKKLGLDVGPGDFAENLTTEGIDLVLLPVGTEVAVGDDVVLEITQIGKECHTKCAIYRTVGQCIMPEEGVFTRVIHPGKIKSGDEIRVA
jgi:MOSC domain-containing protein YiiM